MNIPAQHRRVRTDRKIVATDARGGASKFIIHNARLYSVEELRPENFIQEAPGVRRCDFVFTIYVQHREASMSFKTMDDGPVQLYAVSVSAYTRFI
ncbi:MAG: hypothetical protein EOO61_12760, partial [Hymenobacter sp.]